jgi:serine protease Do
MITSLTDKTPAAEAGLQVEDIILRYNGKEVANEADLRDMISRTAPGTSVAITVLREGRERTVNAKLGTAPEPKAPERRAAPARNTQGKLGVRVTDTDDTEITGQLQLSNLPKEGALIVEVVPGSPASEAGLQPGDTITRINGKRIANAEALTAAVREIKQGTVSLVLRRGENTILARVELE